MVADKTTCEQHMDDENVDWAGSLSTGTECNADLLSVITHCALSLWNVSCFDKVLVGGIRALLQWDVSKKKLAKTRGCRKPICPQPCFVHKRVYILQIDSDVLTNAFHHLHQS